MRYTDPIVSFTGEQLMKRLILLPALTAVVAFTLLTTIANSAAAAVSTMTDSEEAKADSSPFMAQVVGLEWLNPLQRRDYPTEWQLLWTLGLVEPNKNDDMVKLKPAKFSTLQSIGVLVMADQGRETFQGFYDKYINEVTIPFRQNYFTNEKYFYTVKARDKTRWREMAGIRVEIALPAAKKVNTERAPLAWVGYPASTPVANFQAEKGQRPRAVRAWKATLDAATRNVGKIDTDIGYVIHDANRDSPEAGERLGRLAETLTAELLEFDFVKQTFNTPALLGEMGAGTALTDVALGIAYANHYGQNVLVAGTTDKDHPTAVVVTPPAQPRAINHEKKWFRARGENNAYLPWWGIRHDTPDNFQGYSQ